LSPMHKVGLYGFSADPITYGHIDIIKRSLSIFDKLHVCVFNNNSKKYILDFNKRIELVKNVLSPFKNIYVTGFSGLLVDYAYKHNIYFLVRGIRNITDLNYESDISFANLSQLKDIETIYLFAKPELTNISSSMTKILESDMGDISGYVPLAVKSELEQINEQQFRLVLTGSICSGKSTIAGKLFKALAVTKKYFHEIDLDKITDAIYASKKEYYKKKLFKKLVNCFGNDILKTNGTVNKRTLSKKIFSDKSGRLIRELDGIMKEPLWYELRKHLKNKQGLILISGAIIPEKNWLSIANNNVLFIDIHKKAQIKRLIKRDKIPQTKALLKISYSSPSKQKLKNIRAIQQSDNYGKTIIFDNSSRLSETKLKKLADDIYNVFPAFKEMCKKKFRK